MPRWSRSRCSARGGRGSPSATCPGLRRRLAIEFGEPLVLERRPGMSGRAALEGANESIRVALAELVDRAGRPHRSGPADRRPEQGTRALMDWAWDPSLYEGSAPHYAVGRMAYPAALADALRDALGLDGTRSSARRRLRAGVPDAPARASGRVRRGGRRRPRDDRRGAPLGCGRDRVATAARRGAARGPRHVPAGHVRAVVPLDGSAAGRPGGPPDDRARWRVGARLRDDAPRCRWRRRAAAPATAVGRDRRAGRRVPRAGPSGGPGLAADRDARGRGGRHARRRLPRDRSGSRWCAATWWSARRSRSCPPCTRCPARRRTCSASRLQEFDDDLRRLLRSASPDGTFAERARDVGAVDLASVTGLSRR